MIVFDTNVVSELMRPGPAPSVLAWLRRQPTEELFLAAPGRAEILLGIANLPQGARRDALARRADVLASRVFGGRVAPFDAAASEAYADIASAARRAGRTMGVVDAMIAAVARANGAALATRDAGFADCGVPLVNPWAA